MLTHRNLVANVAQTRPLIDLRGRRADHRRPAVLPHLRPDRADEPGPASGAAPWSRCRASTWRTSSAPSRTTRSPARSSRRRSLLALAKHPLVDQYDLSSLRSILSGAAPLDEQLALAVQQRLRKGADAGVTVAQGYGMTELSPVSHTTPGRGPRAARQRRAEVPKGSVGYAIPNTECRLVDPGTGEDAAEGERGELWIRGPQVMKGYLNNEQATQRHRRRRRLAAHRRRRDRRRPRLLHRRRPGQGTDQVQGLPGGPGRARGRAARATRRSPTPPSSGCRTKESGEELPKAFVVRAPGSELSEEAVMDFMAEQVAPHKKIRFVEFIDAVPKSAAGKILRKDLKARG